MPDSPAPGTISEDVLRHFLRAFLDNVPDFVYCKDLNSRFIVGSVSLAKKHGMKTADEIRGKSDSDFFTEEQAREFREDEERIIRTGEPIIDKLEQEVWQDGARTWSLTTKLPLRDGNGTIIGTYGINRDITASRRLQEQLENTHKNLVDASRKAGMADVATGVLHNVGNVLNSLNVAAEVLADGIRRSRVDGVSRLAALLTRHAADLPDFFATPKGQQVPSYLTQLAEHLLAERTSHLAEIAELRKYIDHIKDVVTMQQSFAGSTGLIEPNDPVTLVEDSLHLNAGALSRHLIHVVREFTPTPRVLADRTRVLQIMVNLIRNAKHALDEGAPAEKRLILRIRLGASGFVRFSVSDNGIGIPPENIDRIFAHGFTTRKTGHGFGLHSAANAASELGGALTVESEGAGHGATFHLDLPIAPDAEDGQPANTPDKTRSLLVGSMLKA